MNLREAVAEVLYARRVEQGNSLSPDGTIKGIPLKSWRNEVMGDADATITAFTEALLSEPVVEAVAMERVTGGDIEQWREYRESYPIAAASSLFDAELALTAALARQAGFASADSGQGAGRVR